MEDERENRGNMRVSTDGRLEGEQREDERETRGKMKGRLEGR